MLGAIAGDIIGSVYEFNNHRNTDFELFIPDSHFTDDTVLTVAVADALIHKKDYGSVFREYGLRYPDAGYGGRFYHWLRDPTMGPYNSMGNGSAMRVSPVGFYCDTVDEVLKEAKCSAEVTHNHPEGIKAAQATALAIYIGRTGGDKKDIRTELERRFGYSFDRSIAFLQEHYKYSELAQDTIPPAMAAFLEATDLIDCIRKAVSVGGDSDTIACIAGGIAEGYYGGVPDSIIRSVRERLDDHLLVVVDEFLASL